MRSFKCCHARSIAVLAVLFFSSADLANSSEPISETGAKSAKVPQAASTAAGATIAPSPEAPPSKSEKRPVAMGKKAEKLRFQFRFQPWKDVLDWFAQQADLSLVMDAPPSGTFNYSDTREYTPAEAIDLLNGVLLTKGYTLVRRDRMLMLINIEDGIPANLVSTVPLELLDSKGEFELVSVLFNLNKIRPEDTETEVRKLLGPQGSVVALAKSQQLFVTDTAGRLRAVRAFLKRIEGPEGTVSSGLKTFRLKYARPEEVLPILRQLLEIPEEKNLAADGSIRVAQEVGSDRLLVSGRPDKVARASEIIEGLDVPSPGAEGTGRLSGTPQLEVYALNGCDGVSVLAVLQTLLVGQSDVRLSVDPKTSSLIALARPAQHATIRTTLAQLQHEGQRVEVIRLTRVDPQSALVSINKLFSSGDPKQPSTTAPQIDADVANRQLLIRGTDAQILQIRDLLTKLGEHFNPGDAGQGGRVRTLPMSEEAARAALQRVEEVWPTMRPNKIRIVAPSAGSGAELPDRSREAKERMPTLDERPADPPKWPEEKPRQKPQESPKAAPVSKVTLTAPVHSGKLLGARVFWVADFVPTKAAVPFPTSALVADPVPGKAAVPLPPSVLVADPVPGKAAVEGKSPAAIIVIPGPKGLTITSEDIEALDEFEHLLTAAADRSVNGPMAVFYLKHAKAQAVAETLDKILAGGSYESEGSSEKGSEAARLAASRRVLATGPIKITPESRLNALLVLANRADQDTVEQLLKVLDLKESPEEIGVSPKPRMIAVEHAHAKDIADVLRQIYADRIVVAQGQEQQGRGFMPFFMRGMGGGGGGGGRGGQEGGGDQGGQNRRDEATRISVGVDTRTNTLVIAATDALFEEVKLVVQQLDVAAASQNETVRVVTLHRTSAAAVQKALAAFAGDAVQAKNVETTPPGVIGNNNSTSSTPPWANRGFGRTSGGSSGNQPSMGNAEQPGGNSSPGQGFGGRRRSRSMQPGGPGQ
ncbi:MAG: secretin N-terminal domain-containing protein [Planctomycetota bacterium]